MNLALIQQDPTEYIMKYSIPSIIAMLLTSLVTIVDGLFISNYVGKEALSAIHLGLPLLYFFLGIAIMIGVGGVTIAGQSLGKKDFRKAVRIFNQTYWTGLVAIVFVAISSLVLLKPVIELFNVTGALRHFLLTYYSIIILVYPLMMMNIINGMFIRAEGKPQLFMLISLMVNCINVILDYYFIAHLNKGVVGAAIASGISITLGFIVMHIFFLKWSDVFKFKRFQFSLDDLKLTLFNGSSEMIGQLSMSLTNFLFNAVILNKAGITGIAAMTLVGYAGYVFNMIVVGFGQGTGPLISYSYGANNIQLCQLLRRNTIYVVTSVAIVFYGLLAGLAPYYGAIFTDDVALINFVTVGLRLYTISFILIGYNVLTSFFFTAIGFAKQSAIISSARGLIILSILIVTLPAIWGVIGIWLVAPITECITLVISYKLLSSKLLMG